MLPEKMQLSKTTAHLGTYDIIIIVQCISILYFVAWDRRVKPGKCEMGSTALAPQLAGVDGLV